MQLSSHCYVVGGQLGASMLHAGMVVLHTVAAADVQLGCT